MKDRINDKISEIEEFLAFLSENVPANLEEYKMNLIKKAACERYAEKTIEATVDLAFIFFKEKIIGKNKKEKMPENDADVFRVLKNESIIDDSICKKLQEAKGMRNWLAHEYGRIDDEIIYNSLKNELEKDVNNFIAAIKKSLEEVK